MSNQNLMLRIANPIMKLILRAPFHGMASDEIMLITVTGRKTGKTYTTPVNYVQDGNVLSVVSHTHRTWWRNLRGGASVTLRLRGQVVGARGDVIEEPDAVAESLLHHLESVPQYAEALGIGLDDEGELIAADATEAARGKVMVHITVPDSAVPEGAVPDEEETVD